jgi:hypothetical protein
MGDLDRGITEHMEEQHNEFAEEATSNHAGKLDHHEISWNTQKPEIHERDETH